MKPIKLAEKIETLETKVSEYKKDLTAAKNFADSIAAQQQQKMTAMLALVETLDLQAKKTAEVQPKNIVEDVSVDEHTPLTQTKTFVLRNRNRKC